MRRVVRDYLTFLLFSFSSCKGLLAVPDTFHKYLPGIVILVDVVEVEDLRVPRKDENSTSEMVPRQNPKDWVTGHIHHDLPGIHRQIRIIE